MGCSLETGVSLYFRILLLFFIASIIFPHILLNLVRYIDQTEPVEHSVYDYGVKIVKKVAIF